MRLTVCAVSLGVPLHRLIPLLRRVIHSLIAMYWSFCTRSRASWVLRPRTAPVTAASFARWRSA